VRRSARAGGDDGPRQLELEILGRLAPDIAHDFNNLLAAICVDADMARRLLEPGIRAGVPRVGPRDGRPGRGLTAHVLVNARPRPPQLREVQLAREVEAVAGLVGGVAGEALQVQLEVSQPLPPVQADPRSCA
jgi:C4-dicarboxylate-specific signal transduction histidine kinase